MISLIKYYAHAFFFDENVARRALAALGGLAGSAGLTLVAFGAPAILTWSRQELAAHSLVALGGAVFAALPGPSIAQPPKAP